MQNQTGRKSKYDGKRMELFMMRLPEKQIKQLQKLAVRNGYFDRKSGGVSGYARDLLLREMNK